MGDQLPTPTAVELDGGYFLRNFLRKLPYVFIFVAFSSIPFYIFLGTLDPQFRSEATVLVEPRNSEPASLTPTAEQPTRQVLDQETIAGQVRLLMSPDLARIVSDKLGLASRAEFDPAREASLVDKLVARLGLTNGPGPGRIEDPVLGAYYDKLAVVAIEDSRVIAIRFSSADPELAAQAANTIAEEYLLVQGESKRDTTADAADRLSAEISDLSERVEEAEARIEAFRSQAELVSNGAAPADLPEQQRADLTSELAQFRAQRLQFQARAAEITAGLDSGASPAQTNVLNSPLVRRLVEEQIALRSEIAQLSATLLPQHPRMVELQGQITDLGRQVANEAGKILVSLQAQADVALSRENEINRELELLADAAPTASTDEVDLGTLEREAEAARDLLDSYMRRYRDVLAGGQTAAPAADAQIISRAEVSLSPVFPKKVPLTIAAAATLTVLALALVLVKELASGRSLRAVTAPDAPSLVPDALPVGGHSRWADDHGARHMMPGDPTIAPELTDPVEESLTSIVAQIIGQDHKRILVTLAEGSEESGRPLAAVALARGLARDDKSTVLVDLRGDGANAESMGERGDLPGLTDLVSGKANFGQAIFRDQKSRVHFVSSGRVAPDPELLAAARLETILSALSKTYDIVVLDACDPMITTLGGDCDLAVVVSEFNAADPRTVRAFGRLSAVSDAKIYLLVVDPVPAGAASQAPDRSASEPEIAV